MKKEKGAVPKYHQMSSMLVHLKFKFDLLKPYLNDVMTTSNTTFITRNVEVMNDFRNNKHESFSFFLSNLLECVTVLACARMYFCLSTPVLLNKL